MSDQTIERGLALLRDLVSEDAILQSELAQSRRLFFGERVATELAADPEAAANVLAERRHFEWFVFEHTAAQDGEPAIQGLLDAWQERAGGDFTLNSNSLLHSRAGVFRVGEIETGSGLWLHDLLGHGAFPIEDSQASLRVATDDILAGRIYPSGESQFRLSPAIGHFRDATLLGALNVDMGELRAGRRGTLRLAQLEIERMFFGADAADRDPAKPGDGSADADETPRAKADRLSAEFMEILIEGEIEPERAEAWMQSLRQAARSTSPQAAAALRVDLVDQLAFETGVEIDRARNLMISAWNAFADAPLDTDSEEAAESNVPEPTPSANIPGSGDTTDEVSRALQNFDRGRSSGAALDQLFTSLEQELGLEDDEEEVAVPAPDFPQVVGAIVEEFLWDAAREREVGAEERDTLHALARYAQELGVFEDLGPEHLTCFAARWSADRGLIADGAAARRLMTSLERFARWVELAHQTPLWTSFERRAADLFKALPRTADGNAALGSATLDVGDPERHPVEEDLATASFGLRSPQGWYTLELPSAAREHLRAGDQVAADLSGSTARVLRIYAPQAVDVDPAAAGQTGPLGQLGGGDDEEMGDTETGDGH